MKEAELVRLMIKCLRDEYGATAHKHYGGAFSEKGASDIFGTLPGGRAYYIEAKARGKLSTLTEVQEIFLRREAWNGAVAFATDSVEGVRVALGELGITPLKPRKH